MVWDTMTDTYATIDDTGMTEAQRDKDIVREVRNKDGKHDPEQAYKEEEEKEEKAEMPIPTVSVALEAIRVVNHFYKARAGKNKIVSQIMDTEEDF
jgi:hypothetical protein